MIHWTWPLRSGGRFLIVDSDALIFLADSISELLSTLRDFQDFWTVEELKSRLYKLGCQGSKGSLLGSWIWECSDYQTSIETELFVAENGTDAEFLTVDDAIPELESREEGELLVHVKVSRSFRDECVEKVQRALGDAAILVSKNSKGRRTK